MYYWCIYRVYIYRVKILSGYRVTIPKEVRERWGLEVGDEVEILVMGSKLVLRPIKLPEDPVLAMLGLAEGEKVKLKEIEKAIIGELEEKLKRSS